MTVRELTKTLAEGGIAEPENEARLLIRRFGNAGDAELFLGTAQAAGDGFESAVARRLSGEPLAYIFGEWDFYRETYLVTPAVLIPRQDTEHLVGETLSRLKPGGRFLDLCTGSGCVAVSVLAHSSGTQAVAADISPDALAVAEENARRYSLSDRVSFVRSDVLSQTLPGTFDLIVSNPPYVEDAVYPTLGREIFFEPEAAFVGGADGMDFYRAIVRNYQNSLAPGGAFLFEIGYDQKEKITRLASSEGFACEVKKDYGGNDRVAVLTR